MKTMTKIMIAFALYSVSMQSILTGDKSVGQTSVNVVESKQRILPGSQLLDIQVQDFDEQNLSQVLKNEQLRSPSFIHGNQEVQNEIRMNQPNPDDERTNSFITPSSELKKRLGDEKDKQERYPAMRRTDDKLGVKDSQTQTPTNNSKTTPTPTPNSSFMMYTSFVLIALFA